MPGSQVLHRDAIRFVAVVAQNRFDRLAELRSPVRFIRFLISENTRDQRRRLFQLETFSIPVVIEPAMQSLEHRSTPLRIVRRRVVANDVVLCFVDTKTCTKLILHGRGEFLS